MDYFRGGDADEQRQAEIARNAEIQQMGDDERRRANESQRFADERARMQLAEHRAKRDRDENAFEDAWDSFAESAGRAAPAVWKLRELIADKRIVNEPIMSAAEMSPATHAKALEVLRAEFKRRGVPEQVTRVESKLGMVRATGVVVVTLDVWTGIARDRATRTNPMFDSWGTTARAVPSEVAAEWLASGRDPEALLAEVRRGRSEKQREDAIARRAEIEAYDRAAAEKKAAAVKLAAWQARPRLERALLQLAKSDPVAARLLAALEAEPEKPTSVPDGF